jgi:hypothetical protein
MIVKAFAAWFSQALLVPTTLLAIGMGANSSAVAQCQLYKPIALPASNQVTDTLSEKDIPTGQGGFARDYVLQLNQGDNVAVDLSSDSFDAILTLLSEDGSTVSENDDGPDGSTNALLFTRITKTGKYIVRVRSFGETGVGAFKLKVTRLRPVQG